MNFSKLSFSTVLAGFTIAILLCTNLSAKEVGYYFHTGVTYWNGMEEPEIEGVAQLPSTSTEYELDGSRTQLSLGIGYNLDERWGFEVFYVQTPDQLISGTGGMVFSFQTLELYHFWWNLQRQQTILGGIAVYDFYLNENVSIFAKAGIGYVQYSTDLETVISPTLDAPEDQQTRNYLTREEESQDVFAAVGVRLPLFQTEGSVTFAYQFVRTEESSETNFEFGVQWRF